MELLRVVIVGAGATGHELARRVADRQQVLLLDKRSERLRDLGEPCEPADASARLGHAPGLVCVTGDGSSRLVLRALHDADLSCALVALTRTDEVNLEVGRLAREIGFEPVIAVQCEPHAREQYEAEEITLISRAERVADWIEGSLRYKGAVVPSGIGLGRGELVEIRLVHSSPILGAPLKDLAPRRWRIAAIFREDELIVPTGDTVLQLDDRLLLVGDPKVLPRVSEHLRLGKPRFPRLYGPNVVTLEPGGADEELAAEAEALAGWSTASQLVRGLPGVDDTLPEQVEEPLTRSERSAIGHSTFATVAMDAPELAERVAAQRPGVVVTRPLNPGWLNRLLGKRGVDSRLCDSLRAPVLFARGLFHYQRLLLPISGSELDLVAAEVAIDIVRQLGLPLTAVNVDLPPYISGMSEQALHYEVVPIRRTCELYEVPLDYRHHIGNPIRKVLEEAARDDLMVVVRSRHRSDSHLKPDVALRLARTAPCSVLVLTIEPGAATNA
jgi:Trk K+ transport system NAD-binding subunit/nucleotide-binding universal stress UspA family protein